MDKSKAAMIIAGLSSSENKNSDSPNTVHAISGEVVEKSESGSVKIRMDGAVCSPNDTQEIEMGTIGGLEPGDTATILLTGQPGHRMIPMALGSSGSVDRIVERVYGIEADYVKATELEADVAEFGYAHITDGVIDNATINVADINELSATVADIADAQIANATIEQAQVRNLSVDYASANSLEAAEARIGTLETTALTANSATIQNLEADTGKIHNLTANQLSAATGYVAALTAGNVTAQNIIADHGDFNTVKANAAKVANLTAQELEADHATVGSLDANYAQINMANVNNGWITNGTIKDAAIKSQMVESISASQLTAGTIDADEITVQNLKASSLTVQTADGYVYVGEKRIPTKEFIDSLKDELQAEIDGAIETFTVSAIPTLNNTPANEWVVSGDAEATRKLRAKHVGDIAYVINEGSSANGHCYRFAYDNTTQTFGWVLIQDSDVSAALSRLTTAEGKISGLESFESTTTSWIDETDDEITSIKNNHTSLAGRVSTAEGEIALKVDTTTFNTVKQSVEENSAIITKLSNTTETLANPNLGPFTAWPVSDYYNATTNPNGYWRSNMSSSTVLTQLSDGWMHFEYDRTSASTADGYTDWTYLRPKAVESIVLGETYTILFEIRNNESVAGSTPTSNIYLQQQAGNQFWGNNCVSTDFGTTSTGMYLTDNTRPAYVDGSIANHIVKVTDTTHQTATTNECFRFNIRTYDGDVAKFDFRISVYEGAYDGPYKPYTPLTEHITTSNIVNSVKQTAYSNSAHITNLTTSLGLAADGSSQEEDIIHKYNELDQTLEGTISRVGATEASLTTIGNPNIYPFFSIDFNDLAETRESDEGYWSIADHDGWQTISDCVTILSDGWAHWEYDNTSGTATVGVGALFARDIFGLKQNTTYTAVFEVRNITAPASGTSGWTLTAANASVAQVRYMSSGFYLDYNEDLADGSTIVRRHFTANNWGADKKWFAALYVGVSAGVALSVDVRISVYEGVYNGTFKPYVDPTLMTRMTSAESTITQNSNEISLRVTKTDYEKDVSVRLHIIRNTWTDQTWADHEVIGYTGNYSNENRITSTASATGFDGTTLKIGDLVIIEGVSTDSSTPHYMTCKVNAIPTSATANINMTTVLATSSSGLRDRISSAESSIEQNAADITLRARETDRFKTFVPLNHERDENWFWYSLPANYWTFLDDGWAHYEYTNSGSETTSTYIAPNNWGQVIPGEQYTFLVEIKNYVGNTTSTGTFMYMQQMAGAQFWGSMGVKCNGRSSLGYASYIYYDELATGSFTKRFVKLADVDNLSDTATYNGMCFRYRIYLPANTTSSFDMRISVYPGDYEGPYNEYLTATSSAQLKVASDEISAKVDKDGVIAAINLSVEEEGGSLAKISADKVNIDGAAIFTSGRLSDSSLASVRLTLTRNNWTDTGWAVYEAIGKADNWNNNHVAKGGTTSATGFASNTLRVGDLVVIEGVSTDTGNTHRVTVKVTQAPSGTGSTIPATTVNAVNSNGIVDNIHVGGTNLLWETGTCTADNWVRSNGQIPEAGIIRLTPGSSQAYSTYKVNYLDWDEYGTGTYTFSFEARVAPVTTSYTTIRFLSYVGFQPSDRYGQALSSSYDRYVSCGAVEELGSEWNRFSYTITSPDDLTTGQASALASGSNLVVHFNVPKERKPIEFRHLKLERGTMATDWTPAPEDQTAYVDSSVDGIQFGVTNLLKKSDDLNACFNATAGVSSIVGGKADPDGGTGAYLLTPNNTTSWYSGPNGSNCQLKNLSVTYTFSIWLRADTATQCKLCCRYMDSTPYSSNATRAVFDVTTEWQRFYISGPLKQVQTSDSVWIGQVTTEPIYAYHPKVEIGTRPSDWSPAPEDVAADISAVSTVANNAAPKANAIKRTQRIYYRSSSESKPTAMPTAWVTETGDKWVANNTTASNWTTKVTPISNGTGLSVTKYLYLWTCEQYELASGTVGYTNVLLDDSTTVINGGNIITGSVSANSISATSGTFDTANIPALTADHIKANVISAVNNGTGTINADKINVSAITIGQSQVTDLSTDLSNLSDGISDLNDDLSDESNKRKAVYGTCSTAAGTAAKVVECANFELLTGSKVTIKFTTANTAAAPTLNVNNTGAAPVWYNNAVAASGNPVLWGANATLSFVYDGSHWILDEKPPTYSGSSTTGASTRAKALSVAGALVVNGTTVLVRFSNSNTYTSNSVQFNLSSTGAASIWVDNAATSSSHHILWSANTVITFTRNSNGWFVVSRSDDSKTATNFISLTSDGIKIADATPSTASTYQLQTATGTDFVVTGAVRNRINADGMTLYDGEGVANANIVAKFSRNLVELGQNAASAIIKLCGGIGSISVVDSYMRITSDMLGLFTTHNKAHVAVVETSSESEGTTTYSGGVSIRAIDEDDVVAASIDVDANVANDWGNCPQVVIKADKVVADGDFIASGVTTLTTTVLYTGTAKGDFSLSITAVNFTRLRIYFTANNGGKGVTDVYSPNNSKFTCATTHFANSSTLQHEFAQWSISGTSVTWLNAGYLNLAAGGTIAGSVTALTATTNQITINRVEGWKW